MGAALFWELLDAADGDRAELVELLEPLSQVEHLAVYRAFREARDRIIRTHFPDKQGNAAFEELCGDVVARGSAFYDSVIADPANMPAGTSDRDDLFDAIVASFRDKFGAEPEGYTRATSPKPPSSFATGYPRFWDVLDEAAGDTDKLAILLSPLSREEHLAFYRDFRDACDAIVDWHFEDKRYNNNFQEICWWVVGQGRALYDDIMEHPEKMLDDVPRHNRGTAGCISGSFFDKFDVEVQEADEEDA